MPLTQPRTTASAPPVSGLITTLPAFFSWHWLSVPSFLPLLSGEFPCVSQFYFTSGFLLLWLFLKLESFLYCCSGKSPQSSLRPEWEPPFFPVRACVCVPAGVALARVRIMCTCPRWNQEFNPGCWVRFWNQNVFIRNHPPSYLSAQDGSTSRKKYSALIHVLVSRY